MHKFKRHFRFCRITNHPAYVLSESNGCYRYISLTHAMAANSLATIKLRMKGNDSERAMYAVPITYVADKECFSRNRLSMKFDKADGWIVRDIAAGKIRLKDFYIGGKRKHNG